MKKFYEYNNEKINESVFLDQENTEIQNDILKESGGILNFTPIVLTGAAAAGTYITYKLGKKVLNLIRFGISGSPLIGIIKTMVDNGTISNTAEAYNAKVMSSYKTIRSFMVTAEGIEQAKDINILCKQFGIIGPTKSGVRKAVVNIILQGGKDTTFMVDKLNILKKEGKISEYTVELFTDFFTSNDPKKEELFKKLIKPENTNFVKSGGRTKKIINGFQKAAVRLSYGIKKSGGSILFNNIKNGISTIAKHLNSTPLGRFGVKASLKLSKYATSIASGPAGWVIGAGFLAWDTYSALTWLIGDFSFYEPEEGWHGGKHGRPKTEDSKTTYQMIGTSLVSSIIKICGPVSESLQKDITDSILHNYTDLKDEKNYKNWIDFIIDLNTSITNSKVINGMSKILTTPENITLDITNEFNNINITGLTDEEDWDVIKDAANDYMLDSSDNIYNKEVAEDISFLDYFFIPGMNALGWATVFASERYIDTIIKTYGANGKSILHLLHLANKKINLTDLNFNGINSISFISCIDFLLGDGFYDKHKSIISKLEYGTVDSNNMWKKNGNLENYVNIIVDMMNNSLQSIISDTKKIVITKPILSVVLLNAFIIMLTDILLSGITWIKNFEDTMVFTDIQKEALKEIVDIAEEESAEEESAEDDDEGNEESGNIDPEEGSEDQDVTRSEFSKISGFDDYL